ncbi:MAG: hypothetical protein KBT06_04415 [Prevotellaceae bacterium]|nr:hypothetical protein [Candidatus Colivivens equi]
MKKLYEIVELVSNTEDAVVLKVKENHRLDLICLGCFTGNETMIRLTKGEDVTCTVWCGESSHSWSWGRSGYTLVSKNVEAQGILIAECIQDYFDILCCASKKAIALDLKRKSNGQHTLIIWDRSNMGTDWGCRKDDAFYKSFKSQEEALDHFKKLGYDARVLRSYRASATGYLCYDYLITRKEVKKEKAPKQKVYVVVGCFSGEYYVSEEPTIYGVYTNHNDALRAKAKAIKEHGPVDGQEADVNEPNSDYYEVINLSADYHVVIQIIETYLQ